MNQELQQSKLRLSVGLNLFENVNKSSIKNKNVNHCVI